MHSSQGFLEAGNPLVEQRYWVKNCTCKFGDLFLKRADKVLYCEFDTNIYYKARIISISPEHRISDTSKYSRFNITRQPMARLMLSTGHEVIAFVGEVTKCHS